MGYYITLAYANDYINPNPKVGTLWAGYTDAQKNYWIDYVERKIDTMDWLGKPQEIGQDNAFPRKEMVAEINSTFDPLGQVYEDVKTKLAHDEGKIPDRIRIAIVESIIGWISTGTFQSLLDMQDVNVSAFSAGSASFTFEGKGGNTPLPKDAWYQASIYNRDWWKKKMYPMITRM